MRTVVQEPDNRLLVRRAQRGDPDALEALYLSHRNAVWRIARRLCRRPEDAEDVVQETFMEMVRSLAKYRGEGEIGHWLGRIAASKSLDRLRALSVRSGEEPFEDDEIPAGARASGQDAPRSMARMDLEAALEGLPYMGRAVVWLHDVEGFTHDEIAALVGKTASFSKSQLARAHERLRRRLAPEAEAEACTRA